MLSEIKLPYAFNPSILPRRRARQVLNSDSRAQKIERFRNGIPESVPIVETFLILVIHKTLNVIKKQ
jgi:hypothetical protein